MASNLLRPKNKSTSTDVATDAAKLLSDPNASAIAKSVAGSALTQAVPKKPQKAAPKRPRPQKFKAGKDL